MRFLWIGSFASDEMFDNMPVKSIGQASGVTSQRSFISGIDQYATEFHNLKMDSINVQGIPAYPKYPEMIYKRLVWSRTGQSLDVSIGFLNLPILRVISQFRNLKNEAKRWVKTVNNDEKIHIIVYEPVLDRLEAAILIKRVHPNCDITVIVPDIPEFVGGTANCIKKELKRIRKTIVENRLGYVDKYVFYAKKMADYYHCTADTYIVVEGSIDTRDTSILAAKGDSNEKITFMYSGAVTKKRGLPQFVNAFTNYDDEKIRLWITGAGDYDEQISELSKHDNRITHFGFLKTRREVLEKEAMADVLLHIRSKEEISSTYCFPSKLFEYLASGKPVLSVRIPGIPDEYFDYLIEISDLSEKSVTDAIKIVTTMSQEERNRIGELGRDFVVKNKNSSVQAKKIIRFILNNRIGT